TTAYTRDGSLNMDANRRLVTVDGKPLASSITIPSDAKTITISTDGKVYVTRPGSTASSQVGEIQLSNFPNPAGLKAIGNNLFEETAASGAPSQHTPGQDGMGEIRNGYLERSNVEVVSELVSLITAQRAYEISTRAIRVSDDMLRNTNQIVG
ncbi:MAG TPA: flagellar hook-basal body complex protein, partial [Candidatus Brocadiia bacterium]|nr:flagellar hook-basal body complex protein [Candidatus Brocadiia bacterium]